MTTLCQASDADYTIDWSLSGLPYQTAEGELVGAVIAAVESVTNHQPNLSTDGGTSDGRFIAPTGAQVIELGPINRTIHRIDEQVDLHDLDLLSAIYENILIRLLS
jgi:succinyl-diaminopimelate desuccinylase